MSSSATYRKAGRHGTGRRSRVRHRCSQGEEAGDGRLGLARQDLL